MASVYAGTLKIFKHVSDALLSDVRRCPTLSDIVREAGGGIRTRMLAGDSREIREGFARDSHGAMGRAPERYSVSM